MRGSLGRRGIIPPIPKGLLLFFVLSARPGKVLPCSLSWLLLKLPFWLPFLVWLLSAPTHASLARGARRRAEGTGTARPAPAHSLRHFSSWALAPGLRGPADPGLFSVARGQAAKGPGKKSRQAGRRKAQAWVEEVKESGRDRLRPSQDRKTPREREAYT